MNVALKLWEGIASERAFIKESTVFLNSKDKSKRELCTWSSTSFFLSQVLVILNIVSLSSSYSASSTLLGGLTLQSEMQVARITLKFDHLSVLGTVGKLGTHPPIQQILHSNFLALEPWFNRVIVPRGPWSFIKNVMTYNHKAEFNTTIVHYVQKLAVRSKCDKTERK